MKTRESKYKALDIAVLVVGVAMFLYHMVSAEFSLLGHFAHQNAHLSFALVLIGVIALRDSYGTNKLRSYLFIAVLVLAVITTTYIGINVNQLEIRALHNTTLDLVIGVILVILIVAISWRTHGVVLPVLATIFIAYGFLGHYLPEPFKATAVSPSRLIGYLGIGLNGIYGSVLELSANIIFYFVVFGTLLQTSGATGFFMEVSKLVGRKFRGGTAISCVVSSALVGTCTGSVVANIAATGSFTIPAMKKAGYTPEQAAAIEASASSGGQIMPPILGAAAFIMAGFIGIPYIRIAAAALIPAVLYFLVVGLYSQLKACKLGIQRVPELEQIDTREMLLRSPLFLIPLLLIIYFLIDGRSLTFSAFWAIISCFLLSLPRKETRSSLITWAHSITQGAKAGAEIAVAISTIGMIVAMITLTGLGIRLPGLVESLSAGSGMISLLIVMVVCIILGMGMATVPVYMLVAIAAAPVVVKLGIPILIAHFFVFFYASFSYLTPPVAIGALVASRIAGGSYIKTAMEAVKVGFVGILLPFMFVWSPTLLLEPEPQVSIVIIATKFLAMIVMVLALEFAFVDYYLTHLSRVDRILLIIAVVVFLASLATQILMLLIAGFAIFVFVTIKQVMTSRRLSTVAVGAG